MDFPCLRCFRQEFKQRDQLQNFGGCVNGVTGLRVICSHIPFQLLRSFCSLILESIMIYLSEEQVFPLKHYPTKLKLRVFFQVVDDLTPIDALDK